MTNGLILAIEIGGTKLQAGIVTPANELTHLQRTQVDRSRGAEGIRAALDTMVMELLPLKPDAVGVGFGGPVDWTTGRIAVSHHVDGWNDFPLGDWLKNKTGLPVHVENDANAAAFAEATLGAGVGFNPVFYVNNGSGVGGGLVTNGQLYRGAGVTEMEIGHLRFSPGGDIVEDRCSGWSFDQRLKAECHLSSAREIGNDPQALRVMDAVAGDFAFALSHAVHLLLPAVIVLGGGVSLLGEPWRAAVANHLGTMIMHAMRPGPAVRLAACGENVVPLGAAALARLRFATTSP